MVRTQGGDVQTGGMTIGALAAAAGVGVETIRFYQRRGLLREPARPFGAVRRYDQHDVSRVQFVKSAQRLGFSLTEVAGLLRLEDGTQCQEARDIAQDKLNDVRAKLTDLEAIERTLGALVRACGNASGTIRCPMTEALRIG